MRGSVTAKRAEATTRGGGPPHGQVREAASRQVPCPLRPLATIARLATTAGTERPPRSQARVTAPVAATRRAAGSRVVAAATKAAARAAEAAPARAGEAELAPASLLTRRQLAAHEAVLEVRIPFPASCSLSVSVPLALVALP
uniref:Uncharacterized protein n=1 Tax=Chrysotila carterae TaxID=13221 RepID=A0A7S4EYC0_CHRCT|eukprot:650876-Pleurochrysis_carterae.AAC.1